MQKSPLSKLPQEDVAYIRSVYYVEGMGNEEREGILAKKYNVTSRTIRRWWRYLGLTPTPEQLPYQLREAWERDIDDDTDILLVTSAQNESVAHKKLLQGIEKYKEFIETTFGYKVQIVVIPIRYRNPTTPVEDEKKKTDMWWDKTIQPYLYYNELRFGDTIVDAMARTVPTAKMPLSGHEPNANGQNYVIGSPRIHVKAMPRFKGERSYVLATTGIATYRNYSKSKVGDIAKIHHTYGFTVIEKRKDGICYAPRPVKASDDGTFTDYKYHYDGEQIVEVNTCQAYIWGDIHHREINKGKEQASRQLMFEIAPEKIILHDVFDGSTINPHERDDLFIRKLKIRNGLHLIKQEVDACLGFLAEIDQAFSGDVYVVQSNHDDFLDRHINNFDWRKDLHNSEGYLEYALVQQSADLREHGNIFGCLISRATAGKVRYIKASDPLKVAGYQCGYHGDKGINGAKGSLISFKRLNSKMIHGHGHTPEMIDGVTMVGVSCNLWQYYNESGLSSWGYADAIIHNSGKNQLLIFDEWDYNFSMLRK